MAEHGIADKQDVLVSVDGIDWPHLDRFIAPESTLDEVRDVIEYQLRQAGKWWGFRRLNDLQTTPPVTLARIEPLWEQWLRMRERDARDTIVPAGIAMMTLGLRDLDNPGWSPRTHARAALGFLRMTVFWLGYELSGPGFGICTALCEPDHFLLGAHYPAVRDTLMMSMIKI
ncbi:hypothetical protein [Nocardia sp. NBC_01388]|uniref:hypothetical protein n=1 Tax=Nocardia sp. NBC_01388 TaxID=2903596 RepID=UPI003244D60B